MGNPTLICHAEQPSLWEGVAKYPSLNQLLFMEEFSDIYQALDAEKRIKSLVAQEKSWH